MGRNASEGKWPQKRLDRRLEEVAKAVGGGYCRLQMPSKLALGVRGTGTWQRPGAAEGGGGGFPGYGIPGHGAGSWGWVPRSTRSTCAGERTFGSEYQIKIVGPGS